MAAAEGTRAAQQINADLVMTDLQRAVAPSDQIPSSPDQPQQTPSADLDTFDKDYWERRWQLPPSAETSTAGTPHAHAPATSGPSMAEHPPHPALLGEIGAIPPGTALDAGCGAGAAAVLLARQGWQVTAADIASRAIAQARQRAAAADVAESVTWVEADLTTWQPDTMFDLVTTFYAHPTIPMLDFYRRIAAWVAPGGSLLIVGHQRPPDVEGDHGACPGGDHLHHGPRPPAAASVTVPEVVELLDSARWEILTAQEQVRPAPSHGHGAAHSDVVVRARRRTS